jgi:hypothetical protein
MELIVLCLGGSLAAVITELLEFIGARLTSSAGPPGAGRTPAELASHLRPAAWVPARRHARHANLSAVALVAGTMLASLARPVAAHEICPAAADQMGAILKVQGELFSALENEDQPAWQQSTVRDFMAFEGGRRYGRTAFFELIRQAHASGQHFSWSVTLPRLEVDCTVATLVYVNQGYVIRGGSRSAVSWLETATFRYDAGTWRAVFVESMRESTDSGAGALSAGH